MTGIQCKNGHIFSMISTPFIDAEWKLQTSYYVAQGCSVVEDEFLSFSPPSNCEHCDSLEHEFEELIDEIIEDRDK